MKIKYTPKYIMTSVYSLDGNSIFEVAKRFERLGIQELKKTPLETMARIKSGQDTGSSKWLSDFNNLYGLANQLQVKTTLQEGDQSFLKQQLEAEYTQYKLDNADTREAVQNRIENEIERQTNAKSVVEEEVEDFNKIPDLIERRFLIEIALDIWSKRFTGVTRGSKYKATLRDNLDFIENQQMALKLGSPDVAQQNIIYKTLSQSDSTIANLLQQMTPLTDTLYNTFKSKLSQWTIEIDSNLQEALKDDAQTIQMNFSKSSASPEISKYAVIFKRLQKKYNELNNIIQNMGSTIDDRASINLNPNEP
jgi:hypothetical protein